ncbi:gephyrin-like molybdotransferase Glp [Telmatospirillum sp. J64-1]|uniref:molybdopterin molybdotransferase MoeA n=1 Tax=Telmatospirillum sp. J64-1 TaxID=2502183 RepID=UPI00351B4681
MMAQDLNDCFKAPETLLTLDQALAYLDERLIPVVGTETVPLAEAGGRVLAEDLVAELTQPPFANAAMDGFCFRAEDVGADGARLRIVARIAAGHVWDGTLGPGEAARIFTGAPMPAEADTMAMQEDCQTEDGDWVRIPGGLTKGNFVRQAGDDFMAGSVVLPKGKRLRPHDLSMAAANGRPSLTVYRRLRVGVFSTGDEIVEPGNPLPPGAIYCSNRFGIVAAIRALGCDVHDLGNIPDRPELLRRRLDEASRQHDLLITAGGVSVGGEDHVRGAVESLGAIHLWRMAIKPGKPTALGTIGDAAFLGLPGYPVSSLVILMLIGRPVILRLSGAMAEPMAPPRLRVKANFSFRKRHPRRQFLRCSLVPGPDGSLVAEAYPTQESNVLSSLVRTQGLVDLAEDAGDVAPGDLVDFLFYEQVLG